MYPSLGYARSSRGMPDCGMTDSDKRAAKSAPLPYLPRGTDGRLKPRRSLAIHAERRAQDRYSLARRRNVIFRRSVLLMSRCLRSERLRRSHSCLASCTVPLSLFNTPSARPALHAQRQLPRHRPRDARRRNSPQPGPRRNRPAVRTSVRHVRLDPGAFRFAETRCAGEKGSENTTTNTLIKTRCD